MSCIISGLQEGASTLKDFLPGLLKTVTLGYDGKGQYPIDL